MRKLNIIFVGSSDISAKILLDLYDSKYNIQAIITQPDKVKNRGQKISFSLIKYIAISNSTLILQPKYLRRNILILDKIKKLKSDVIIVVAYGIIFPKEFLDIPKYGCLNVHLSLLPKWRGAAPVQRAIQAGDSKTGITIIKMNSKVDAGNILNSLEVKILDTDNTKTLYDKLTKLSSVLLIKTLENIKIIKSIPQIGNPTYAYKINKNDGLINFNKSAWEISCHIRAFIIWPESFFILDKERITVGKFEIIDYCAKRYIESGTIIDVNIYGFDIKSSDKIIRFKQLQFPNKKMLNILDILNSKNLYKYIGHRV